jgi:TonB family protein
MSNYLIELFVVHIGVVMGYWLFLRNERQYAKMRFYLLGTTLLALIIPLLKLPKLFFHTQKPMATEPMRAISLDAIAITPAHDIGVLNYELFIWLYIAISGFFLFKFLQGILQLISLERRSIHEQFHDLPIRRVNSMEGSFTFFNWIFLSDEIDKSQHDYQAILKHEKAHASLGHTYDLVFFELFKVAFWWLPTAWVVIKEIKKIHEYQADAYVLKTYDVDQYSTILINSTLESNGLTLTSSFHDGLILKRLKAMKQQTKNVSPWKLGVLGVLCLSLFVVFACSEDTTIQSDPTQTGIEGEVFTIVEEQPEYPGGIDALYQHVLREIRYPKNARIKEVEGQVVVQFVVEKDGSISNVKAIKGIDQDCDQEAVRVIQTAAAFTPGSQRGKKVRVQMIIPIIFKLDQARRNADQTKQGMIVVEKVETKNGKLKVDAKYRNGVWSGTIYSREGDELPGANIIVAGTSTGTVSDLDGTFSIKANAGQDLQISFVGYESVQLGEKQGE